ncbi:MAG: hypothetical protein Q8O42_22470 [Acidobacteriota bacterium]|nr:hypothetical protein [Acidobacteriota bacterium]
MRASLLTHSMLVVFIILGLTIPSAAQKGGKGGGGTVSVEFPTQGLGLAGDRIDHDGAGPYVDGQQQVSATLQNAQHRGDIVLNLERSPRTMYFEFAWADCTLLDGHGTPACGTTPFGAGTADKVVLQTRQGDLPSMAIGETKPVILHGWFSAPDPDQGPKATGWFVRFNPGDPESTGLGCHSSYATVTRTSSDGWVVEADANREACLLVNHPKLGKLLRGRYRMPFRFTVTQ